MTATSEGSRTDQLLPLLRVFIVSEVRLYRDGFARVLAERPELEVADGTAEEVLVRLGAYQPRIVLADSLVVRTTDLVARAAEIGAKVVAFGVAEEDEKEVLACAEAGVAGFVGREATFDELVVAMKVASRGDLCCSPRVASLLVRRIVSLSGPPSYLYENLRLTRRQGEIASLLDRGLSNKEIASRLCIDVATVKNHVHYLLEKLQVHRRAEAAAIIRQLSHARKVSGIGAPDVAVTRQQVVSVPVQVAG